ncbi:MAG: hypothetical protein HGN29_06635 [Asgard group archaeon]|nr:hypothetical protein [Asgard group archaeon]
MISFCSIINDQIFVRAQTIENFSFSNNLKGGTELEWKLSKYEKTIPGSEEGHGYRITETKYMSEGDVFKVILEQHLNNFELEFLTRLYNTNTQWGEFFLNDVSLGKNPTDIFWLGLDTNIGVLITAPIIPIIVQESTSYFDYIENNITYSPENEIEGITLKNTEKSFSMKYRHLYSSSMSTDVSSYLLEVLYNKEWGILSKYYLHAETTMNEKTSEIKILYEIENEDIKVPYNWTFGFVALFVTGIVILIKRRKK